MSFSNAIFKISLFELLFLRAIRRNTILKPGFLFSLSYKLICLFGASSYIPQFCFVFFFFFNGYNSTGLLQESLQGVLRKNKLKHTFTFFWLIDCIIINWWISLRVYWVLSTYFHLENLGNFYHPSLYTHFTMVQWRSHFPKSVTIHQHVLEKIMILTFIFLFHKFLFLDP